MPPLGLSSGAGALGKLDGRSKEARLIARVRRDLLAHLGGAPTAVQRALVDRAAWLSLHVAQLDAKAAGGEMLAGRDAKNYSTWSGSLTRALRELGMNAAAPPRPDLADYIATKGRST